MPPRQFRRASGVELDFLQGTSEIPDVPPGAEVEIALFPLNEPFTSPVMP
jgi:hypothetical protein